jgi:MMPL family
VGVSRRGAEIRLVGCRRKSSRFAWPTEAKMFALALGGGILIDATIIRGVLAPAAVALLGRWTWWLSRKPARILRVAPSERCRPRSLPRKRHSGWPAAEPCAPSPRLYRRRTFPRIAEFEGF